MEGRLGEVTKSFARFLVGFFHSESPPRPGQLCDDSHTSPQRKRGIRQPNRAPIFSFPRLMKLSVPPTAPRTPRDNAEVRTWCSSCPSCFLSVPPSPCSEVLNPKSTGSMSAPSTPQSVVCLLTNTELLFKIRTSPNSKSAQYSWFQ